MSSARKIEGASSVSVVVNVRKHLQLDTVFYAGNACVYADATTIGARNKSLAELAGLIEKAIARVETEGVESLMQWVDEQPNRSSIVSPGKRVAFSSSIVISNWASCSDLTKNGGPFEGVTFAGPLYYPLDGVSIIADDGEGGLNVFLALVKDQTKDFLENHLIKEFAVLR